MPLDPLNDPLLRAPRSHAPTIAGMTEAANTATPEQLADFVDAIGASGGGGGGHTPTDLGATATPTGVTVTSSTGTDALLPLSTETDAGLMAPAQHAKLADLPTAAALAADQAAQDLEISGKAPATHTHTPAAIGAATAAQGAKADTALQPGVLPAGTTLPAAQISDATAPGRSLLTAADAAAQRTALALGNVSNTADADKPVSTAQALAIAAATTADAIADTLEAAATVAPADLARIRSSVSGDVLVSSASLDAPWEPTGIPSCRDGDAGALIAGLTCTAADIYSLWDALMSQYPDRIARNTLGVDQSGTYSIYEYVISPTSDSAKTILLTGAIHGSEVLGSLALFLTIKSMLLGESKLSLLSASVTIKIAPVANPWSVSQSTRVRFNSRGVDLNRNWGINWGAEANPGSAAWSEAETRVLRDWLQANAGAVCYLDCHNLLAANWPHYTWYHHYDMGFAKQDFRAMVESLRRGGETTFGGAGANASAASWAATVLGIPSVTPEYPDGKAGAALGAADMAAATRWFGNCLKWAAKYSKRTAVIDAVEPRTFYLYFDRTGTNDVTFNTDVWTENPALRFQFSPKVAGIVEFYGELLVTGGATSTSFISACPVTGQSSYQLSDTFLRQQFNSYTYNEVGGSRRAIPFFAAFPCDPAEQFGPVTCGMALKTGSGTATVNVYRAIVKFTPSDASNRVEWWSCSDGVAAGMTRRWPTAPVITP